MSEAKKAINWRNHGAEMIGIIFAVLLALWLEEWREDVERQDRAGEFVERIRLEVEKNRADIFDAIVENQKSIDGIKKAFADDSVDLQTLAPFLGISGGSTSNAAWTSAQMTQAISEMPVETVMTLSAVYDTQAFYAGYVKHFFERYTDIVVAIEQGQDVRAAARRFQRNMEIANSIGRQVIDDYDAFLGTETVYPEASVEDKEEAAEDTSN